MSADVFFTVRSMSQAGQREKTFLRQCIQARTQLEEAIAGVMKAEVQLKSNSREVSHNKSFVNINFSN